MPMWFVALIAGCGGSQPPTAESCADICAQATPEQTAPAEAKAESVSLTAFEKKLLDPMLADLRQGVRPWSDESLGICTLVQGKRECTKFLGRDVGELPPGEYQLFGEFASPDIGEKSDWVIVLTTACTIHRGDQTIERPPRDQSYEIPYSGKDRGYRLSPMQVIRSPSDAGRRECTWKVTAKHPDGDKEWTGSWTVPEK